MIFYDSLDFVGAQILYKDDISGECTCGVELMFISIEMRSLSLQFITIWSLTILFDICFCLSPISPLVKQLIFGLFKIANLSVCRFEIIVQFYLLIFVLDLRNIFVFKGTTIPTLSFYDFRRTFIY